VAGSDEMEDVVSSIVSSSNSRLRKVRCVLLERLSVR
jgi:hypothetical protein